MNLVPKLLIACAQRKISNAIFNLLNWMGAKSVIDANNIFYWTWFWYGVWYMEKGVFFRSFQIMIMLNNHARFNILWPDGWWLSARGLSIRVLSKFKISRNINNEISLSISYLWSPYFFFSIICQLNIPFGLGWFGLLCYLYMYTKRTYQLFVFFFTYFFVCFNNDQ